MKGGDIFLAILGIGAVGLGAIYLSNMMDRRYGNGYQNGVGIDWGVKAKGDLDIFRDRRTVIPKRNLSDRDVVILIEDYIENNPEFDTLSARQKKRLLDILVNKFYLAVSPEVDLVDIVRHLKEDEKAYVITEGDFDYLDINRKERKMLNRYRRLTPDNSARVVYGLDLANSSYVNAITPFGYGKHQQFARLGQGEQTLSNTDRNTINLYEDS